MSGSVDVSKKIAPDKGLFLWVDLVGMVGFEPTSLSTTDFKSVAFAVSPHPRGSRKFALGWVDKNHDGLT